jgi:hypothetical protein
VGGTGNLHVHLYIELVESIFIPDLRNLPMNSHLPRPNIVARRGTALETQAYIKKVNNYLNFKKLFKFI